MTKSKDEPTSQTPEMTAADTCEADVAPPAGKKRYIFPDVTDGSKAVAIEATSIDEATELYRKQKGDA